MEQQDITCTRPKENVTMVTELVEELVASALIWVRSSEPVPWCDDERFHVATGFMEADLMTRIGSYWEDVRVVRVELDPINDPANARLTMTEDRWAAVVPHHAQWVTSQLTAVAVLGPPTSPDAVLVHTSEHVEDDDVPYAITQIAVVLPNERTGVDTPTVVWLPAPFDNDLELDYDEMDEIALNLPVTRTVISQALRAAQSVQRLSLTIDHTNSFPVCLNCWEQRKNGELDINLFNSHRQSHHTRLGICVDSNLAPVIDAIVEQGWMSYAGCEGTPGQERSGYLALHEKLSPATRTALEAAGCTTHDNGRDGTVIYWDPLIVNQVVDAIHQTGR